MDISHFIHGLTWSDLPESVQKQAKRCLLDTIGAAVSGRQTDLSRIIYDFVVRFYGGRDNHLWFDGRATSLTGAVLAHGMTIDALDIHDGDNLAKGHAGVALVPTTLNAITVCEAPISGRELLTTLVMGYELALRAGRVLHKTACDYHTSGAWNALGCAAIVARYRRLTAAQTRHALGIAEYHGPRSQMMRVIDHPTMLKDGSGWGAMAGVSAALLAEAGFTGAPAVTVENKAIQDFWADLGKRWLILEQYFKPQAVCRWAQPAIEAASQLQAQYQLEIEQIRQIEVRTFHEAVRLATKRPQSTEEAQYSLPFPVTAALVHGRLGAQELSGEALHHPQVHKLIDLLKLVEEERFNDQFPAVRQAQVIIETTSGQRLDSGAVEPQWDAAHPPTDEALREKFRWLATQSLPVTQSQQLEMLLWHCDEIEDVSVIAQQLQ